MNTCRTLVATAMLSAVLVLTGGTAHAQDCQPGLGPAYMARQATYDLLIATIVPNLGTLATGLSLVSDQTTYATLLADARTVASSITNGRVLVSLPDGTVVLDTGRPDDPTNVMALGNSYKHFQSKTVNETE